ncbi:type I-E CRISPR-associated protein Cas7/Cse4/CasC [Arcanobacterium canis]
MSRHLTFHVVNNTPHSNLNRDDSGTPKRVLLGGALRALHSSQSIKRGIRLKYEQASLDTSVRSGMLVDEVVRVALQLAPTTSDEDRLKKAAVKIIGSLTKDGETKGESARSAWMSMEEITAAAQAIIDGQEDAEFIQDARTGSLAIAAFGRMFANEPRKNTEAALAVSPGVTTHATTIESDYFSTVDDIREREGDSGATFLGVARYVNGTFYRTVTIDKVQLRESWSGFAREDSIQNLRELIRAVVYGAPRGKENSTAPYTLPSLIIAEEQRYRTAYSFETPVRASREGGYEQPTIQELDRQFVQARSFDKANFGPLELVAGTAGLQDDQFGGARRVDLDGLIEEVVNWVNND